MFKWICLAVAVVFLTVATWMLNDIRLQVRRTARTIDDAGQMVNEELPAVVERSRTTSEVVSKNLPEVVEKVRNGTDTVAKTLPQVVDRVDRTTEVMADLAEDVRQLKELAGLGNKPRDKTVAAYADSVLKHIAASGGVIGVKKTVGRGLKNTRPAADWVAAERREAVFLTLLGRGKKELLQSIGKTRLGFYWYIQLPGQEPVRLLDWLRETHPETKELT
jgi:hypothetical protein